MNKTLEKALNRARTSFLGTAGAWAMMKTKGAYQSAKKAAESYFGFAPENEVYEEAFYEADLSNSPIAQKYRGRAEEEEATVVGVQWYSSQDAEKAVASYLAQQENAPSKTRVEELEKKLAEAGRLMAEMQEKLETERRKSDMLQALLDSEAETAKKEKAELEAALYEENEKNQALKEEAAAKLAEKEAVLKDANRKNDVMEAILESEAGLAQQVEALKAQSEQKTKAFKKQYATEGNVIYLAGFAPKAEPDAAKQASPAMTEPEKKAGEFVEIALAAAKDANPKLTGEQMKELGERFSKIEEKYFAKEAADATASEAFRSMMARRPASSNIKTSVYHASPMLFEMTNAVGSVKGFESNKQKAAFMDKMQLAEISHVIYGGEEKNYQNAAESFRDYIAHHENPDIVRKSAVQWAKEKGKDVGSFAREVLGKPDMFASAENKASHGKGMGV